MQNENFQDVTPLERHGFLRALLRAVSTPLVAVILGILLGSVIIEVSGYNAIAAYVSLFQGAFGSGYSIANTLANAVPLILAGLGVAVGFRAGLFNIGAEGQYWMGAIAAVWVGYAVNLPWYLHIPLALAAAAVAGALWGGIVPGLAKAYAGAHEVITTMMMSYVAIFFSHYLLENGPMMEPGYVPQSPVIRSSAFLPVLVKGTQLSAGIFVALAAVAVVYWVLYYTTWGFEIRALGLNRRAARYGGMPVQRNIVLALAVSGLLAGLAGAAQMMGVQHRLYDSFSSGYGYTAIVVALLAKNDPIGVVFSALLFAALGTGAQYMQIGANVPGRMTDVITGLIVFFVAAERMVELASRWLAKRRQQRRSQAGRPGVGPAQGRGAELESKGAGV